MQKARAAKSDQTRQRIVDAGVELHRTVGPAATSMSAVADLAGVSRPTLYEHFPSEAQLFQACTLHWLQEDPPPDPSRWVEIQEPRDRVELALTQLYENFDRNPQMSENVFRDMYIVPSMMELTVPVFEAAFNAGTEILARGFDDQNAEVKKRRLATVAAALSFDTWRVLTQQGCATAEAVDLMTDVVVRAP